MFIACAEMCFKLRYSFCLSLYSAQCCMIYSLCEPLFCRKKTAHVHTHLINFILKQMQIDLFFFLHTHEIKYFIMITVCTKECTHL